VIAANDGTTRALIVLGFDDARPQSSIAQSNHGQNIAACGSSSATASTASSSPIVVEIKIFFT
jgi:hypothetical protein